MNTRLIKTLEHVRELLAQAPLLEPEWESKDECYQWVEGVLRHFRYQSLTRPEKGLIKQYLSVATGYSRAQITRLISACLSQGRLRRKQRTSNGFTRRYTKVDIRFLAATDQLHNGPNGAAIKKLCERAFKQGDQRYVRLKDISVSHIYNLRQSKTYRNIRTPKDVTKPTNRAIGIRCQPRPEGQPGFIRIDTVHQGDKDKVKGVYRCNSGHIAGYAPAVASCREPARQARNIRFHMISISMQSMRLLSIKLSALLKRSARRFSFLFWRIFWLLSPLN